MGMAVGINMAVGVDVSLDHNSMTIGRGIGGVRNGGVVICGRVGVRSLVRVRWEKGLRCSRQVLAHIHIMDILSPAWFQLFWSDHIKDNLKQVNVKVMFVFTLVLLSSTL